MKFNFKVNCKINYKQLSVFDSLKLHAYLVKRQLVFLTEFVQLPKKCSVASDTSQVGCFFVQVDFKTNVAYTLKYMQKTFLGDITFL